jgi:hypothetical protein
MVLGDSGVSLVGGLVFVGLALAVGWMIWKEWLIDRWNGLKGHMFALGWWLVPFGLMAFLSLFYPLFQLKQTLMLLVPLLVLLAAALIRLPRAVRVVLASALIWVLASSLGTMYREETKDGWREAGDYIETHYQEGDLLYLNPAAGILALEPYLAHPLARGGYPPQYDVRTGGWEGTPVTAPVAERELEAATADYGRIWLIEYGPEFWDPEGHLLSWLEENGRQHTEQEFGEIRVRLYELAR